MFHASRRNVFIIFVLIMFSNGVQADVEQFVSVKEKAESGDPEAQYKLAHMYMMGSYYTDDLLQAPNADLKQAAEWFQKSAEQGYLKAQKSLGDLYEGGIGVKKDLKQAIKWYQLAAEQDSLISQKSLAKIYYYETEYEDIDKSLYWFRKAALKNEPNSQFMVGAILWQKEGGPAMDNEAKTWFKKAAANGDEDAKEMLRRIDATEQ